MASAGSQSTQAVIGKAGSAQRIPRRRPRISLIRLNKGEIAELPVELDHYAFDVDHVLEEGEDIKLSKDIVGRYIILPVIHLAISH